jgi:DNA-binding protein HU-beta
MNKKEVIDAVHKKISSEVTKAEIDNIVIKFMDVIKDALINDDKVTLVGFGTFLVKQRKATTGINPQTKKPMKIPAKKYAKLKFSDKINKKLNK